MTARRSKWARFTTLSPAQRRAFVASWLALPWCWMALHVAGLRRLERLVQGRHRTPAQPAPSIAELRAIGEAVRIAARYAPLPTTCLTRSLVLAALLRRQGVECSVRIGVRLADGVLAAHAWVEHEGEPVNDMPDIADRFPPFPDTLPISAFAK